MAKAKFTYDESGATFFYFVLSFLALILVPSTYYLWPNESTQEDDTKAQCNCNGCQNKKQHLVNFYKWKRTRRRIVRGAIIVVWIAFVLVAYKCATIKHEYVNWDPFEILGVRENATPDEIKKAYRKLSLIFHPDKDTGDSDRFVKITKAYAALTDDEARKNWEQYGNPDGPGATSFGIALPSWIVEKENSVVVLGIYALVFMVALPVSVGLWWYRSVKFGCDKVLLHTTELFYHFIYKTPDMVLKRVLMILSASLEFAKSHNPEVVERETDNIEVPRLIRDIPRLSENNKERPLCFGYSIKTRAILHAHLGRMKLPANTLELDRCFIVRKCEYLLQEFVQCVAQLITLALAGRIPIMPKLNTLENAMKLSPLIVQALWEFQSPLLQLPHFTEDTLRYIERRKLKVRTTEQLARMKEVDRRNVLKNFTDVQYQDIKLVLSQMPLVSVECKYEVLDDEDPGVITAGSIVTVVVKLTRRSMKEIFNKDDVPSESESDADDDPNGAVEDSDDKENVASQPTTEKPAEKTTETKTETQPSTTKASANTASKTKSSSESNSDDEDAEWDRRFQEKVLKKQKVFESKPRKSHPVHCPYFPDDKQEFWWVYVVDRKRFALVTAPLLVTSLVDSEEVELKFTAPHKPGTYSYTIVVRSDSYVDSTIQKMTRIDIKPAKEYVEVDYDIPEEEGAEGVEYDEDESAVEDSDLLTDTDD